MKPTKPYIKAGYDDKIVFADTKEAPSENSHATVLQVWQRSQGLWKNHPVFGGMNAKEAIEWLRGEDCDV